MTRGGRNHSGSSRGSQERTVRGIHRQEDSQRDGTSRVLQAIDVAILPDSLRWGLEPSPAKLNDLEAGINGWELEALARVGQYWYLP